MTLTVLDSLNPYFIGLSTLIFQRSRISNYEYYNCLNPYFIGLSTLIFNLKGREGDPFGSLNPYFIGLSTLI